MGFASRGVTLTDITAAVNTSVGNALASNKALTLDTILYPEIDLSQFTELTVLLFQAQTFLEGTLSLVNMAKLNDGDVVTSSCPFAVLNDYAIIDLGAVYKIKQYRHYGTADMNADGEYTIDYLTVAGWQNWATFATRVASWAAFAPLTEVAARWLRLKATTLDTFGVNSMMEVEVKF